MCSFLNEGWCYGCRNNGCTGMKHPKSTDAYTGGHLDGYFPFDFVESSSSEDVREFSSHLFFSPFLLMCC